jgi:hypothetical protein
MPLSFQKSSGHINIPVILTAFISINTLVFSFAFQIVVSNNYYRKASLFIRRRETSTNLITPHFKESALIPRIRIFSSYLAAAVTSDHKEEEEEEEERDRSNSDDHEIGGQDESNVSKNVNEREKTKPSILPPPPKETSYRFPLRKRGARTRIRRTSTRSLEKGEHYKSILPPPKSTTTNVNFSDGRKLDLSARNIQRKRSLDNEKYKASNTKPSSLGGLLNRNNDDGGSLKRSSNEEQKRNGGGKSSLPSIMERDSVLTSWDDSLLLDLRWISARIMLQEKLRWACESNAGYFRETN